MEAKAIARFVRISPRKVKLVAELIRGKSVDESLTILRFVPKSAATVLEKVVKSALANAAQLPGINTENLYVAKAVADQGPVLKRFRPRAMGRATPVLRRTSHITVILKEKED